jgi:dolichol-phosphate mannosyltransferase
MKQTWSIIIFCFNEVETVAKVTRKTSAVLQELASDYEIVIVDDGSTDGSQEEISRIAEQIPHIRTVFHLQNKGIGHALRSGYEAVKFENVCAVPADGQFDLNELLPHTFVAPNSFVSFYRKENTTYTLARNVLSLANRKVNEFFLGMNLKDVNWVKIYKKDHLHSLDLEIESSLVESEICAKLIHSGIKPTEVVSKYMPREAGQSKGASLKIVRQAMFDTLLLSKVLQRFRKDKSISRPRLVTLELA